MEVVDIETKESCEKVEMYCTVLLNWERGRAVSFLGIYVSNFPYSVYYFKYYFKFPYV
jgi:hypothetical protein